MPAASPSITATDKRAAEIVRMHEDAGKIVRRVVIEGKRVEVEFAPGEGATERQPTFCLGTTPKGAS